jgi:hypothetical protein
MAQKKFMKARILIVAFAFLAAATFAAETNLTSQQAEAKYTQAIEVRTDDILKILALNDTNKIAKVHGIIIAQYRALNAWHDANDANLKAARKDTNAVAKIRASLKVLHNDFLAKLSEHLSPEQVDQVKDKMTYGKVQFTLNGYLTQYPDLPEANRQKILELLKEAREEAMDGGSAEEKTAVFQQYKGKINNYLSKEGIHPPAKKAKTTNSVAQ